MSHKLNKMSTVEARENFSELINLAAYGNKRYILTRRGRPVAGVVSISDLKFLNENRKRLNEEDRVAN